MIKTFCVVQFVKILTKQAYTASVCMSVHPHNHVYECVTLCALALVWIRFAVFVAHVHHVHVAYLWGLGLYCTWCVCAGIDDGSYCRSMLSSTNPSSVWDMRFFANSVTAKLALVILSQLRPCEHWCASKLQWSTVTLSVHICPWVPPVQHAWAC